MKGVRRLALVMLAVAMVLSLAIVGCQQAAETPEQPEAEKGITKPEDLKGKKVGVQVDTTGQLEAEKILGKDYPDLKKYDDILTAFADLAAGRIEAIVNDKPVSAYVINKTYPDKLALVYTIKTNEGYGIWFKQGNTGLRDAVSWALGEIVKDGTYATIYKKWFGAEPDTSGLEQKSAPMEKPDFKTLKDGEMSFGADTAFPPFEFKEGAEYVGFDVNLGTEVCKRLGVKYKIVSTAWDGIIPSLKANKFDAIMSSMTITEERKKEMIVTDPYIVSDQSIAAKKM